MYHMEQPTGDASAIVFAIGCKAAAENTNICYSGEGADEFLVDIIYTIRQSVMERI